MWYVYILYSKSKNCYYVGYSEDPVNRLIKHNNGETKSTKSGIPWELVYKEEYQSKGEAIKREREIKRKKSRKYIEWLINK